MQFSLLLAEALQAIGGIVNVNWIQSGMVEEGNFCRAQGLYDYMLHRSELKSFVNRNHPEYRRDGCRFQHSCVFL